ncbi:MAG: hypothetical protein QW683_08905 [Candidatus Caldarchaeum sp.]
MRKHQHLLVGAVVIAFFCSFCFLGYLVYTWPTKHPVPLHELLVDPQVFPPGWKVRLREDQDWEFIPERAVKEDHWAAEGVMRTLEKKENNSYIWHRILRYRNEIQAEEAFLLDLPGGFSGLSWNVPKGWNYRSSSADRFRFACTFVKLRGQFLCSAMARYGEIISIIWFYENDLQLDTLEEIEMILSSVDKKIGQTLKR